MSSILHNKHKKAPSQADPSLCLVQQEMSLLIFRYLKQKLRSSTEANTVTQALLK